MEERTPQETGWVPLALPCHGELGQLCSTLFPSRILICSKANGSWLAECNAVPLLFCLCAVITLRRLAELSLGDLGRGQVKAELHFSPPRELQSLVKKGVVSKARGERSCFADLAGDVYPSG